MSYHKVNYVPSTDKTEKGQWNDFDSARWQEFQSELGVKDDSIEKGGAITFVDVEEPKDKSDYGFRYWKNDFDTVVFILDLHWHKHFHIEPLAMVHLVRRVGANEFDYVPIADHKYIVRMWWD